MSHLNWIHTVAIQPLNSLYDIALTISFFSSPGRSPGRAIVLPPASALALALAAAALALVKC